MKNLNKPPSAFNVFLVRDNFTPEEFIVNVVLDYFNVDKNTALEVAKATRSLGQGLCGTYSMDVAFNKAKLVQDRARQEGHPLICFLEEV